MTHQKKNKPTQNSTITELKRSAIIALLSMAVVPAAYSFNIGPISISFGDEERPAAKPAVSSASSTSKGAPSNQTNQQMDFTDPGVLAVSDISNRPAEWPTSPHCRPLSFISKLDVDTAYARAMRSLPFQTNDQVRNIEKRSVIAITDPIYKHSTTLGSYYRMEQLLKFRGPNGEAKAMHMSMTLSKEGAGTAVEANYCTNPREPADAEQSYHDYVNKTIRKMFL